MNYRNYTNARDQPKDKVETKVLLGKTKLSQTATSSVSSKTQSFKRDSVKNNLPAPLSSKTILKEQDLMTQSRIIQARNGLQLLKKKMNQKGMIPLKGQRPVRSGDAYIEDEYVHLGSNQLSNKPLTSENLSRTKPVKQHIKKSENDQVRKQESKFQNLHQQIPIKAKNCDFQRMLEQELRKQNMHQNKSNKFPNKQSLNSMTSQYPDNQKLYQCHIGCGRTFKKQILQKHQKVCQKVFMQQRKAFDSAAQRHLEEDIKNIPHKPKQIQSKITSKSSKLPSKQQSKSNMPKWKLQSLQLRNGLKRAAGRQLTKQQMKVQQMQKDALTQCSFCMRRFNAEAAKRHIPVCQQKSKRISNKTQTNIKKKW